jgi:hypothetical protein
MGGSMNLTEYKKIFHNLAGWVNINTINITERVNQLQLEHNIRGNLAEIGLLEGKFFLALLMLADDKEMAFGCDIKIKPGLIENIQKYHNKSNFNLYEMDSRNWDFEDQRYRIIHVDGDHTAEMAYIDIENSFNHLSPGGVVIVDDMFHPQFPGVTEAVCEAIRCLKIFPFIGGGNKIWITNNKDYHKNYFDAFRMAYPQWGKTEYYGQPFIGCQFNEWREK